MNCSHIEPKPPAPGPSENGGRDTLRILLVDDQPARLLAYESILEGMDVQCVRSLSGKDALARVLHERFALILLDVSMPEMDGFETARLIRQHPRLQQTPIIFATGIRVASLDVLRGYEAGAIDYISVPIVPEILRSKVAVLVDLHRQREELEALRNRALMERRRAERVLEARTEELERVLEVIPAPIWIAKDAECHEIFGNRFAAAMLGLPLEQNVSRTPAPGTPYVPLRFYRGDRELAPDELPLQRAAATGTSQPTEEIEIKLPDGSRIALIGGAALLRDEQERVRGAVGAFSDITEHKRAERALAVRTDELRQIFNAAAIGLARCSRDLRYLAANPAYAKIAGLPLQQIVGRRIDEVIDPSGLEAIRPCIERALGGESVEYEGAVSFSASGNRLLHVTYTPWREPGGSVSGWVASVMDVTARVRAEEKVRAANKQKDQFLAILGHELRNPLAPIRSASELLSRIVGSQPEAQAPLAILRRQTEQLARLVDDLLDVSRIAQGLIRLTDDIVDIGAAVDQAVEMIKPLIQEKSHRLSIRKPDAPLYARGDSVRLVQAIGNVLHNAAKYTENRGRIAVEICEAAGEAVIAIRDSGCGIAPELLPHIFELFVQSPRSLDRSQGGLGVGLSVVKQLVEMHRGTVVAESAGIGCGATFTVRLPCMEAPHIGDPRAEHSLPPQRILIVDDNVDAASSLAMLLGLDGHEVSTVFSGPEALRAVEELHPALVLLDIGLPVMNGYEVARRLRARHSAACPPLIALTGYGQLSDREEALAAGFAAHLTKPVELKQLREMCWRILKR